MRSVLLIAFAALAVSAIGRAEQKSEVPDSSPGLACFQNLVTPEYPRTALQAHVDGSVWTWIHVSQQGTIDKIDTQVVSAWGEAPKLLAPPVEKAIRASKIRSECAGKQVWAIFRYEVHGEPTPDPKVTSRTEAPNMMLIESQPSAPGSTKATN